MLSIRTILCPVDFSPASARQVDVAVDLSGAFSARLILHHNLTQPSAGTAVGWMWSAEHPVSDKAPDRQMRDLIAHAGPEIDITAHITRGVPLPTVLSVAEAVEADLLVVSTHGDVDDDRPSFTERILTDSHLSVLALHEPTEDDATPRFSSVPTPQVVVVPTDFSKESLPAVEFAFEMARRVPVQVHLLHLESLHGRRAGPTRELEWMAGLVPDDLADRARLHIEHGDPGAGIAVTAARLGASCIVMGEHTRGLLRRWLSRDTAKAVLRRARCPVWYVPASAADGQGNPQPSAEM